MPTLDIPHSQIPGLRKLATLDAAVLEALVLGLREAQPGLRPSDLVAQLNRSPRAFMTASDLRDTIEVVMQMAGTLGAYEVLPDQFAADVVDAMRRETTTFQEPVVGWKRFAERLAELLKTEAVGLSSRADDIQHEEPNIFTTARILTDIRPVFEVDAIRARGALIIHNLKITYFHNGDYRDLYISMDNADLTLLRSVLDRAEKKSDALKAVIDKAGLTYFAAEQPQEQ